MSGSKGGLSRRGRAFVDRHILRRSAAPAAGPGPGAAPARPATAAPPLPPGPAATPSTTPAATPASVPPRRPRTPPIIPADRLGTTSPEPAFADADDRYGNDSPDEGDAPLLPGAPPPAALPPAALPPGYATLQPATQGRAEAGAPAEGILPPGYTAALPAGYAHSIDFGPDDGSLEDSSSSDESSESSESDPAPRAPHAKVVAERTPTGMAARPVGREYEGEFERAGWRGASPEAAARTDRVTRLYTEQEQQANELTIGQDGRVTRGGAGVGNQKMGYAMDATGRMVAFDERDDKLVTRAPDGSERRTDTTAASAILSGHATLGPDQRLEMVHHSSVLGAEPAADGAPTQARPAAAAGFVSFDWSGRIVQISNCSGHYKPAVDQLAQAIEYLTGQGAFFADELTDAGGRVLNANSKEGLLYAATQRRMQDAARLAEEVGKLSAGLQAAEEKGDQRAQDRLGARLAALAAELAKTRTQVEAAGGVLRKLGVGPSQRMRPGVTAEYVEAKGSMTGAAIRTATTQHMGAAQFARTGGGNRGQEARKQAAMAELTRFTQADRDRMQALTERDPATLSAAERAELRALAARRTAGRTGYHADQEASARARRIGGQDAPAPDLDAALAGMGVEYDPEADVSSEDESSSEEWSEDSSSSSSR